MPANQANSNRAKSKEQIREKKKKKKTMSGNSEYYNGRHGWETTSHDYPNAHLIVNKKVSYEEEDGELSHHHRHHDPRVHRKVQFVEETTEIDKHGTTREVYEKKTIDEEANGFIQQKRKNFEVCKWDTFKEC